MNAARTDSSQGADKRAKYSHIIRMNNGDALWSHFHTEYEAVQSHCAAVGRNGVRRSEVRFSDFGGPDCSPRIIAESSPPESP